ncbi:MULTISPECIES: hypothetical protein [Streptomyces]|uniref:hypothetical protein n=1 Tax=Streptomyces TaxID=1883 RepID=UPI00345C39B3
MPASKAQQAATAERRAKAIRLRLAGLDFDTIADQLGYASRGAATKDVIRALEKRVAEVSQQVEVLRQLRLQRLDHLHAAYWPEALQGNSKAAEIVLKIDQQRAKLEGTDAPQRVEVLSIDAIDEQIRLLTDQLTAADAEAGETPAAQGTPE